MEKFIGAAVFVTVAASVIVSFEDQAYAQRSAGFTPCGNAQTLVASATSVAVTLNSCGPTVLVWNVSAIEAFITISNVSATASTSTSLSIPGNTFIALNGSQFAGLFLSSVTATATTVLRIQSGYALQ